MSLAGTILRVGRRGCGAADRRLPPCLPPSGQPGDKTQDALGDPVPRTVVTRIALDRLPVLTAALVYFYFFFSFPRRPASQPASLPIPSSSSGAADDRRSGVQGGDPRRIALYFRSSDAWRSDLKVSPAFH